MMKYTCTILLAIFCLNMFGQQPNKYFTKIYSQIELKNFFGAKDIYAANKTNLSSQEKEIVEALLDNAFNKLEKSNRKIKQLLRQKSNISDSLILKLYKVQKDNFIKLCEYKEAKNTLEIIMTNYKSLLSKAETADIQNTLKIWTTLADQPKQQVIIKETNRLKLKIDKAGLKNLKISASKDTVNFIFDTGANISTVLEKIAKKLEMKIFPVDINVETITGQTINAQLAICPLMKLGAIEIRNAVFLVFKDDALYFPEIDYQINGILGYPVIEALREIQISQDGYFTVPKEETRTKYPSNMALCELIPLICIDGKHFTFDTGADATLLYRAFYLANQKKYDAGYKQTKISFGGAAGKKEFDGFITDETFRILNKEITLNKLQLLKEKIKEDETVYGNIGQDLIKQFNKMTINFDHMFIKFD